MIQSLFPRLRRERYAFLLLMFGIGVTSPAAANDDIQAAREHFEKGLAHAQAGDTSAAAIEFEEAYRLRPHFSVLYNLGHAYLLTGRPVQALEAFTRYLELGADGIDAERRAQVEQTLRDVRQQIGSLKLSVSPVSSTVELDGVLLSTDWHSAPTPLSVGRHVLIAEAQGHAPAARSFLVEAQKVTSLEIALEPLKPLALSPEAHAASTAPRRAVPSTAPTSARSEYVADHEHSVRTRKSWAYILGASGIAFSGAALGFAILAANRADEYQANKAELGRAKSDAEYRKQAQQVQNDALAIQRFDHLTIGSALLGAGLLGTGMFLYFTADAPKKHTLPQASLSTSGVNFNWGTQW